MTLRTFHWPQTSVGVGVKCQGSLHGCGYAAHLSIGTRVSEKSAASQSHACIQHTCKMFARLLDIDLQTDYAAPYEENRAAYLADAEALKKATGPYKAARDAYVAATATFTKSLYE